MELSERCIQTLEKEGFTSVYEESRSAGEVFLATPPTSLTAIFVTEGSILATNPSGTRELLPGARLNLEPQSIHALESGPMGCQYVIGER